MRNGERPIFWAFFKSSPDFSDILQEFQQLQEMRKTVSKKCPALCFVARLLGSKILHTQRKRQNFSTLLDFS